jgi:cation transport ATPase
MKKILFVILPFLLVFLSKCFDQFAKTPSDLSVNEYLIVFLVYFIIGIPFLWLCCERISEKTQTMSFLIIYISSIGVMIWSFIVSQNYSGGYVSIPWDYGFWWLFFVGWFVFCVFFFLIYLLSKRHEKYEG